MIEKDEIVDEAKATHTEIISKKRKSLEDSVEKVRVEVTNYFQSIINSIKTREKQLLRQIEAVHNHQLSIAQSNWEFACSIPSIRVNFSTDYSDLEQLIHKFGKIEFSDNDSIVVKNAEPYKVEEYEDAHKDHVSFDKSIKVNEKNNDDISKLCGSPNTEMKSSLLTNTNYSPINSVPNSSSGNSSFNTSLEKMASNLYLDPSLQQKIPITRNYDCSLLCSPPINDYSKTTKYNSKVLDMSNDSYSHLYINKVTVNNSSSGNDNNEITSRKIDKKLAAGDICSNTNDTMNCSESIECSNNNEKQNSDEQSRQIQEWLQQILVETETEPSIQEIEQFAEISKSRYRGFEFSLET